MADDEFLARRSNSPPHSAAGWKAFEDNPRLFKTDHFQRVSAGILQPENEDLFPCRLVERMAPDVWRRLATGGGATIR